jgi:hypothetical protein
MVRAVFRAWSLAWVGFVCSVSACNDLSEFRGTFDGSIVKGNFVRSCFSENTKATIRFNPDYAVGDQPKGPNPNWLTTSDGTFEHTTLEAVQDLEDDQLSLLDFPGPKRLRNYLLFARPKRGPLAQRDAFVVISLLENKRIELRVIARTADARGACAVSLDGGVGDAGPADAGQEGGDAGTESTGPREYFGLFRLSSS